MKIENQHAFRIVRFVVLAPPGGILHHLEATHSADYTAFDWELSNVLTKTKF